jgi:hypothetical protein
MEIRIKGLRFVAEKPKSAVNRWVFFEWLRPLGTTSYRLFLSSAFFGWGLRLVNCGDGSVPAPMNLKKHL